MDKFLVTYGGVVLAYRANLLDRDLGRKMNLYELWILEWRARETSIRNTLQERILPHKIRSKRVRWRIMDRCLNQQSMDWIISESRYRFTDSGELLAFMSEKNYSRQFIDQVVNIV